MNQSKMKKKYNINYRYTISISGKQVVAAAAAQSSILKRKKKYCYSTSVAYKKQTFDAVATSKFDSVE